MARSTSQPDALGTADYAIVTALADELRAVLQVFPPHEKVQGDSDIRHYYRICV
jgi:hypothetical protein